MPSKTSGEAHCSVPSPFRVLTKLSVLTMALRPRSLCQEDHGEIFVDEPTDSNGKYLHTEIANRKATGSCQIHVAWSGSPLLVQIYTTILAKSRGPPRLVTRSEFEEEITLILPHCWTSAECWRSSHLSAPPSSCAERREHLQYFCRCLSLCIKRISIIIEYQKGD